MLIPNKFNGYSRDGIRLYHSGGGGRSGPPPPPNPNSWEAMLASRGASTSAAPAAPVNPAQPAPVAPTPEQGQKNIERDRALSQTRGGRPSGQDSQFYQPAYEPQFFNIQ